MLPVIDVAPLLAEGADEAALVAVAAALHAACVEHGFFYISGHGVPEALSKEMEALSHEFFSLPEAKKAEINMEKGGRAWRGSFSLKGELTSGRPDLKEGLYLGLEHAPDHPRVLSATPTFGQNLFPDADVPRLRPVVLEYIGRVTAIAHAVMRGIALSLGLPEGYFRERYTADPTVLFRIFSYPDVASPAAAASPPPAVAAALASAGGPADDELYSVGCHTDYGLLTLLLQDDCGGLEVRTPAGWIDAPPLPGTFVCNVGDILDRVTGGLYRSTPHRVRNTSGRTRLSFPLFFDPGWDAVPSPIEGLVERFPVDVEAARRRDLAERWDGTSVHEDAVAGVPYGAYLLRKVGKVFPQLAASAL